MNNKEFREMLRNEIYTFALKIVKLCTYLRKEQSEYLISGQLFKAGTSVGANYEEAMINELLNECEEIIKITGTKPFNYKTIFLTTIKFKKIKTLRASD